jgi:hypothetical protein
VLRAPYGRVHGLIRDGFEGGRQPGPEQILHAEHGQPIYPHIATSFVELTVRAATYGATRPAT